jgi:hypothetical protein
MLNTLARARRVAPWALLALVATALPFARAADCTIPGASTQVVLYQDTHFTVVGTPAAVVTVDLSKDYPPPPSKKPPYIYGTNFHPALGVQPDAPLLVRVCPVGVTAGAVWNLELSMDDMVDPLTNQSISAQKVAYSRRMLKNWTTLSNEPTIAYTGVGGLPVTLALYFQVQLDGSEQAGGYRGAVQFEVLAAQ